VNRVNGLLFIRHCIKALFHFKLRSLVCLLSVAFSIAAFTVIAATIEGAYQKAFETVERFGPDGVVIHSGALGQEQLRQKKTLTLADADVLRDAITTALYVLPITQTPDTMVSYKGEKIETFLIGSLETYSAAWRWPIIEGSEMTALHVRGSRNVCLLGQYVLKKLFTNHESPIGKYIIVKNIPCQVIGVLNERGMTPSGRNLDDRVVMPLTTVMKKILHETKEVNAIRVRFIDQQFVSKGIADIKSLLRERHKLQDDKEDDFRILSPDEIIKLLATLSGSLVGFLGTTAIVTLIVAGFIVANLFHLSVKERTKEIGIRRALGATQQDIRQQFLMESTTITVIGGLVGFVFGVLSSRILILLADFPLLFSWKAFILSMVLSALLGVVFGLSPASKAANLNPIEAVR
jgi:putative ABC transport system permease protein